MGQVTRYIRSKGLFSIQATIQYENLKQQLKKFKCDTPETRPDSKH